MNKTKIRKLSLLHRLAAMLMLCATLLFTFAPAVTVRAVDVQVLNDTVAAATGFTHAARVTWDDLNAADASIVQVALFPIPTNTYIDRVAFYIEEGFTSTTAANTNLYLTVGVGGTTNAFFGSNMVDTSTTRLAAGETRFVLSTNMLIPYKSTTSTNYLTTTWGGAGGSSTVDDYQAGKMRFYWRLVNPAKTRF